MREVIKTAATVDEAIALALVELQLPREKVTCEVLQYPEKKFFGFKKIPAQVKVSELEEAFSVKEIFADKKEPAKQQAPKAKKEQPKKENKKETKQQPKQEKAPKAEKPAKAEVKETKQEVKEEVKPVVETVEETVVSYDELSEKAKYAMDFLESVISQFHKGNYTLTPVKSETGYVIKISGDDAGALIGRKGETMEALSYLTGLAANRSDDSFEKISVDVADYRQKREKDLEAAAKKAAAKVLKTGRPFGFEPMNPYDRRIIHAAISQIEGVKSESKGEGANRRVMVYSTNPKPRNNDKKGGKKPYNKNNRQRREKPAPQAQKTREEKLIDESSFGLYSKIEL